MKNTPTGREGSETLAVSWQGPLSAFDADLRRKGAAEPMRRAYGDEVAQFAAWAIDHGLAPASVTPQTLRRYAAALSQRRASRRAIAQSLGALRAFFRVALGEGELHADPTASTRRGGSAAAARAPTSADVAALVERVPAHGSLELRDRALFHVAVRCALRVDELIGLDVASVSPDGRRLRVPGRPTTSSIVEVDPHAASALRVYLARGRPPLVVAPGPDGVSESALFLSKSGRRLTPSDVRRRIGAWTRRLALAEGIPVGWMRHALVSGLLERGHDLRAIQELLGRRPMSVIGDGTRVESAQLRATYAHSHPRA